MSTSDTSESKTHFVVSARKYRPIAFDQVVGQAAITDLLEQAIAQDKIPHAMLFCGPRGVGKTSCARIFAYSANQLNRTNATDEVAPLNIFELDAASNNSVEDIRNLTAQVHIPPQQGRYKVYIIDEVHMLSRAAFNAFLKTLEEPPQHAIFILATTEKHKVLPTVLSRCQLFHFKRVTPQDTVAHLQKVAQTQKIDITEDACFLIARKSEGSLRDALTLLDMLITYCAGKSITLEQAYAHLDIATDAFFMDLTHAAKDQNRAKALVLLDQALSKGMDLHHLIISWCVLLRDVLLVENTHTQTLLHVSNTQQKEYEQCLNKWSPAFVLRALDALNTCEQTLYVSRYPRLHAELTIAAMCEPLQNTADALPSSEKKN